jgi:predicted nucleic acid-binding protein
MYLDMCCLKRPFDDQRQPRIQMESLAVASILDRAERGSVQLVRSPAHDLENGRNPREDRRLAAVLWLDAATAAVALDETVEKRASVLRDLGFSTIDALHVAFAERAAASCLVTTDDRLIAAARRHRTALHVDVRNPIEVVPDLEGARS